MSHQQQFEALVAVLKAAISPTEHFTLAYDAEASDFIRFNHGQVRQAGSVQQVIATFKLIDDGRHANLEVTLSGDQEIRHPAPFQRLAAIARNPAFAGERPVSVA
ncbi:Zn-dependent protease [Pseudomonas syringae pv. rhaphiolepidis]|nr:Zn-dependent protease [Pseudomonas syringae pv. rhaphiolepidis]KWS44422.1 hypothetical protein AL060_13805 [Pseudomonas syringae pv. rhaphiolepidis]